VTYAVTLQSETGGISVFRAVAGPASKKPMVDVANAVVFISSGLILLSLVNFRV